MLKRLKGIGLLLIANVLIFLTLSFAFNLLVNVILPAFGIDLRGAVNQQDLLWALVIGFGGAFISLAFSKQMAVRCWTASKSPSHARSGPGDLRLGPRNRAAAEYRHAGGLGLRIPDPNAFATGPSKNNSMVAVSTACSRT